RKEFETNRRILSFQEYLALLAEEPERQLRGSAQYLVDMLDHFGKTPLSIEETAPLDHTTVYRFHLFDLPIEGVAPKLVGQEEVQSEIYHTLVSFARQGMSNKLVLLHGPNGSAKSTLIQGLMGGME